MNVKEVALFWGVSETHVRRLCASGRVPSAKKIKGRWTMNKWAAKPFDRRFKEPTMLVIEVLSPEPVFYRRLCDYKNYTVKNGIIVLLSSNMLRVA